MKHRDRLGAAIAALVMAFLLSRAMHEADGPASLWRWLSTWTLALGLTPTMAQVALAAAAVLLGAHVLALVLSVRNVTPAVLPAMALWVALLWSHDAWRVALVTGTHDMALQAWLASIVVLGVVQLGAGEQAAWPGQLTGLALGMWLGLSPAALPMVPVVLALGILRRDHGARWVRSALALSVIAACATRWLSVRAGADAWWPIDADYLGNMTGLIQNPFATFAAALGLAVAMYRATSRWFAVAALALVAGAYWEPTSAPLGICLWGAFALAPLPTMSTLRVGQHTFAWLGAGLLGAAAILWQ